MNRGGCFQHILNILKRAHCPSVLRQRKCIILTWKWNRYHSRGLKVSFEYKTWNKSKVIYMEFQDQDWPKTEQLEADVGKEKKKVVVFIFWTKCLLYFLHWKKKKKPKRHRCGYELWLHRHIFSSLSIDMELMSQDTYSLSYGNFIPHVAFSCRLPGFLYHIMIPTRSLDTAFIVQRGARQHLSTPTLIMLESRAWYQMRNNKMRMIRMKFTENIWMAPLFFPKKWLAKLDRSSLCISYC